MFWARCGTISVTIGLCVYADPPPHTLLPSGTAIRLSFTSPRAPQRRLEIVPVATPKSAPAAPKNAPAAPKNAPASPKNAPAPKKSGAKSKAARKAAKVTVQGAPQPIQAQQTRGGSTPPLKSGPSSSVSSIESDEVDKIEKKMASRSRSKYARQGGKL